jgi:hypothetical protein
MRLAARWIGFSEDDGTLTANPFTNPIPIPNLISVRSGPMNMNMNMNMNKNKNKSGCDLAPRKGGSAAPQFTRRGGGDGKPPRRSRSLTA